MTVSYIRDVKTHESRSVYIRVVEHGSESVITGIMHDSEVIHTSEKKSIGLLN